MRALTETTFTEAVQGSKIPAIVKFEGPGCTPCKVMVPVVAALEKELGSRAAFFSVSVEDAPRVAERNAVNTLPTIIIYAIGGKSALGVLVGATSLSRLRKVVEEALAKSK